MTALLLAACAAIGVHLLVAPASRRDRRDVLADVARRLRSMLDQAGLEEVSPVEFVLASAVVGVAALVPAAVVFGPGLAAAIVGIAAACVPAALWRRRRDAARRAAREAWPRLIEEIRVLTTSAGRSIPQALIDVGLHGPPELRPAFRSAQREWVLTTDFERTVDVLKRRLADPTADATCETLLVAAEVGGDLDSRLTSLAEDRRQDLLGRQEAVAKQAGARLARAFVVLVPAGMAFAGLSVGDGRSAYRTAQGQALVVLGLALVAACWIWAGRIMRLPEQDRVFE